MALSDWLLIAAIVDAALGMAAIVVVAIRRHGRVEVTSRELAAGVLVALGIGVLGSVLLLDAGFTKLHGAYLVLTVALPVIGAATIVASVAARRDDRLAVSVPARVLAAGLVVLAGVGFWGTHVEPFRLRTDRASLDVAQIEGSDEPIRIGVIADLQTTHIGDHEWQAIRRLNRENPDIVVMPGDFIQGNEATSVAQNPELQRLLGALEAPGGVFLVAGDVDSPERLARIVASTDLVGLDNEITSTVVRGRRVWIGGLENDYRSPAAAATIDALSVSGEDTDLRVLVSHRPDTVFVVGEGGKVDLVVAGHTHGGQVALPFFGPPVILSEVPRSVGAGGLHDVDGQAVYVGTGVGLQRWTAPQLRFLVRPSVGLVELR